MEQRPPRKVLKLSPWGQKCLSWASRLGHPTLLSTLATSGLVLGIRLLGALQGLELGIYDQLVRLRPTLPADDRILIVGIGEIDVQQRQEWPIQDQTIVELLDVLLAAEPRAIGLDLFRDVPIADGQAELLTQIQNHEQIVPVCKISGADTPGVPPPQGTAAGQIGFSDLVVDPGGILRRSLLVAEPPLDSQRSGAHICSDPEMQLLSLSFQLVLRYLAADDILLDSTPNGELRFQDTILRRLGADIGGYQDADASGYQILLNFRAARDAFPQVSLSDVLSGQVPAEQIRDRIILIGATTPEAKDDFYTPYSGGLQDSQKMPGVVIHAQSVSQILSAVLNDRPLLWSWSTSQELVWIVVWGFGGALFAWYVRRPIRFILGTVGLLAGLYGSSYLLFLQGGWIPIVPPALTLTLAAGSVILLDRFNKSDYGKAVYQQMKSLLRLDIEIDQSRVGQQVAEITETEYFTNLQQQARNLRQQRANAPSPSPIPKKDKPRSPQVGKQDSVDDYFDNLKREARRLKPADTEDDEQS